MNVMRLKDLLFGITLMTMPSAYSSDMINLPEPRYQSDFSIEQAIHNRRSVREFSNTPLSLAEISQLLWSAQGVTGGKGLRSAPSAGALYPLKLYLVAGNVKQLKPGIYQYLPGAHQLRKLKNGDSRKDVAEAALQQYWMQESAAMLIYSAIEKRTTRKYGQRGIRYIHIEVGHSAENVFLQAQSLGLAAAVVGAFDDRRMKKILDLTAEEQLLYLMPLGKP